jgi:hypothetical protein
MEVQDLIREEEAQVKMVDLASTLVGEGDQGSFQANSQVYQILYLMIL